MPFLDAGGHRLEYLRIGPGPGAGPVLVLLHEGLGCVSMWRDFPERLAAATGLGVLVYSRWGYGRSDPLDRPHPVRYMHDEALLTLPEVLAAAQVDDPVLVGHSDGGSIALIYAGAGKAPRPRALVTLAAHVFCEDISVRSIAAAKQAYETTDLKERLGRHHGENVEGAFRGWNDVWLHPDFRRWNIEEYLPAITCPALVIQGEDDEYGTLNQVDAIRAGTAGPVETLVLPECGHSPQRDQPEATLAAIARFVAALDARRAAAS